MAKKLESNFANMIIVLSLIGVLSGGALYLVHQGTAPLIEENALNKVREGIVLASEKGLTQTPDNDPLEDVITQEESKIYPLKKGDLVLGYVVESRAPGYGGDVVVMAGYSPSGEIWETLVLSHQETPGLGSNISGEGFRLQFRGVNPQRMIFQVKKDGGDVDALTAATVSSRAYAHAVDRGAHILESYLEGGL